jgi:hypothetical protein
VLALDGRNVERRRQVRHDRVEELLDALVLEGGAAGHGHALEATSVPLRRATRISFSVKSLVSPFEVTLHQCVVHSAAALDELFAGGLRLVLMLRRDFEDLELGTVRGFLVELHGLHANEVDDAVVVLFETERQLHRTGLAPRRSRMLKNARSKSRRSVHLVDEAMRGTL